MSKFSNLVSESLSFPNDEFIKSLNGWIFENHQGFAKQLASMDIPKPFNTCSTKLYRGMSVSKEFVNAVNDGNMVFNGFSSWSKSKEVARKFASDLQFKTGPESGPITILLTHVPNARNVILDIDYLTTYFGEELVEMGLDETNFDSMKKEEEVLMRPGLRIRKKDMIVITK